MARDSTKVMWRVQCRKSRAHKWTNKGLFETRRNARTEAKLFRDYDCGSSGIWVSGGYGFGNTRVVRHVRGQK